jgi:hypothetical protein
VYGRTIVDIDVNAAGRCVPDGRRCHIADHRPIQKARDRFPGAGSIVALNSCDGDNVPVICPTCQFLCELLPTRRSRNRSAAEELP